MKESEQLKENEGLKELMSNLLAYQTNEVGIKKFINRLCELDIIRVDRLNRSRDFEVILTQELSVIIRLRTYILSDSDSNELTLEKFRFLNDCAGLLNGIIKSLHCAHIESTTDVLDSKTIESLQYLHNNLFEVSEQVDPVSIIAADPAPPGVKPETWSQFWKVSAVAGAVTTVAAGAGVGIYEFHEHFADGALHAVEAAREAL